MLSNKEIAFLRLRNRGGENNSKGNRYEDFFAIRRIAYWARSSDSAQVSFSAQVEGCFVDDLEISFDDKVELYQLKDVAALSWGQEEIKSLKYGFRRQEELMEEQGMGFHLYLVNSHKEQVDALTKDKPSGLRYSSVIHFPSFRSLREFLISDQEFHASIRGLCGLEDPSFDKLESLSSYILGIWHGSSKMGIFLADILAKLQSEALAFARPASPSEMDGDAREVLNALPDFSFAISGGYLQWKFRDTDSGTFQFPTSSEEFRSFEKALLLLKPKYFSELEPMLLI